MTAAGRRDVALVALGGTAHATSLPGTPIPLSMSACGIDPTPSWSRNIGRSRTPAFAIVTTVECHRFEHSV